jgi:phosphoribosylformimino-5-aminoimidazole carboxamide ribotide isomerase
MEIIPAIDCISGKCVRLTKGDYNQKTVYNDDPLEVAKAFEQAGIKRLHLVDLDGAKLGKVVNWKVLEQIATHTNLKIDFGGGIKQEVDLENVFNSGATWATIGSLAAKQPEVFETWIEKYESHRFFLGADVRNENIAVGGWLETTNTSVYEFIEKYIQLGLTHIFCTDISKDGTLEGPAIELYEKIISKNPKIQLVASGGVKDINCLIELQAAGCSGAIIGKALYENRITLEQLKPFLP